MPKTLTCPCCQRRLLHPSDSSNRVVQCPSCQTRFWPGPVQAARVVEAADIDIPDVEPADLPTADPSSDRFTDRPRPLAALGRPSTPLPRPSVTVPAIPSLRRSRGLGLLLGRVTIGLAMVALIVVMTLAWTPGWLPEDWGRVSDKPWRNVPNPALPNGGPLEFNGVALDLQDFFADLGAAFRARDADRLVDHFDLERLLDELAKQDLPAARLDRDREQVIPQLRKELGPTLQQQATLFKWNTTEIKNIKPLDDNELVVIARHRDTDGTCLKMRWWLTRRSGVWKIYNVEDLDIGLAITRGMAALLEGVNGVPDARARSRAVIALREALGAIVAQQDLDLAERKLRQVAKVKLPPKLDGVRLLVTGILYLYRGQFQDSLDTLNRAQAANPDMPCLGLFKGVVFNRLGQWARGLERLEAYRDLLGEDAVVCRELGVALRGVGRFLDAAAAYRKALEYDPKDVDTFMGLLGALGPDDARQDIPERFAQLDNRRDSFDVCAEDCRKDKDRAGLEQLCQAMRKLDPLYAPVDFYSALLHAWQGDAQAAVPLFRSALARQADAAKRQEYVTGFLVAMAEAGKAVDAYDVAPEPREAFRLLAAELKKGYRPDDLRRLVSLHGKKRPADPLLPFYEGEAYAQQGYYHLAERSFAAGMARPPEDVPLELFRPNRVLARYYAGQGLSAYQEIGPRDETFAQLAGLYFAEGAYDALQILLDTHARTNPNDIEEWTYRARLSIKQGKVNRGITLFRSALDREKRPEQRQRLLATFLQEMASAGQALEAYAAAPDPREAFRTLADYLRDESQRDQLRQLLNAHRQKQPDDIWLTFYTGTLSSDEQAWERAAQVLMSGWKQAPDDLREMFRSHAVYCLYQAGRWREAYEKVGPREQTFTQLTGLLAASRKGAELEAVIAAHQAHAGESPDLLFQAARAKVFLQQPAAGNGLLHLAFGNQSDHAQRCSYVTQYLHDMIQLGQGLEAYRTSPDRVLAFQTLANHLVWKKQAPELAQLLAEHGKDHPPDKWHRYYCGDLNLLRGDARKADPDFTEAHAQAASAEQWRFRNGLFRARVAAGKTAETYREHGSEGRPFVELANICLNTKNAPQLAALLAAHRATDPADPSLPSWELELKWLEHDYTAALTLLLKHRGGLFAQPRHRATRDQYLIRCLIRLKRADEAVPEAEALAPANQIMLVLAHAAHADAPRTIAIVEKLGVNPFLLSSCYRDEDLGPILRSERFRTFRERFPEPKEDAD
jgi:tetratricopeptide (TPR) repeat protein